MRLHCGLIVGAALAWPVSAVWALEGGGLAAPDSGWLEGHWQSRVELNTRVVGHPGIDPYNLAVDAAAHTLRGARVFGDFYFVGSPQTSAKPRSALSGFRATSGLVVGSHGSASPFAAPSRGGSLFSGARRLNTFGSFSADGQGALAPVPYIGLGYTELPDESGWGFRADFGLMALSPKSAVRLGGVLGGAQSIDELLRELRLSPLIQLGVSYSF